MAGQLSLAVSCHLITILLLTSVHCVRACGPLTHAVIAHHASLRLLDTQQTAAPDQPPLNLLPADAYWQLFDDQHLPSILLGSSWPDYLYHCGQQHDVGELTHWSYYQREAALYIRERYSQALEQWKHNGTAADTETEQLLDLLSFLLGAASHSTADISWHGLWTMVDGLPQGYGMIETIGAVDGLCDPPGSLCSKAHDAADYGMEFVVRRAFDHWQWLQPQQWKMPTDDLIAIFQRLNISTVSASLLHTCQREFQAMLLTVIKLGPLLYHAATDDVPTLQEQWLTMPIGGLTEMTLNSVQSYKRWLQWVDAGPPPIADLPDRWRPDANTDNHQLHIIQQHKQHLYNKLSQLSRVITSTSVWPQYDSDGDYSAVQEWLESVDAVELLLLSDATEGDTHEFAIMQRSKVDLQHHHSMHSSSLTVVDTAVGSQLPPNATVQQRLGGQFGSALLWLDSDHLVIAEPCAGTLCSGSVYSQYPSRSTVETEVAAGSQRGTALAALDLDGDGQLDLVTSALDLNKRAYADPHDTDISYSVQGGVTVHWSINNRSETRRQTEIDLSDLASGSCCQSWSSLAVGAGGNELFLTAPMAGLKSDRTQWMQPGVVVRVDAAQQQRQHVKPALIYSRFEPFSWLGSSVATGISAVDSYQLTRLLFIGSPAAQQVGMVEVTEIRPQVGNRRLVLRGEPSRRAGKFGASVAYNTQLDLLAISAISADAEAGNRHSGLLYLLHTFTGVWLQHQQLAEIEISKWPGPVTQLLHPSQGARFGAALTFAQLDQQLSWHLVATAPQFSPSYKQPDVGAVLIYSQPHTLPANQPLNAMQHATYHLVGNQANTRFGQSLAATVRSFNTSSGPATPVGYLMIGLPLADATYRIDDDEWEVVQMAGAVVSCTITDHVKYSTLASSTVLAADKEAAFT